MPEFVDLFDGNRTAIGELWGEYTKITPQGWYDRVTDHLTDQYASSAGVYPLVTLDQLYKQSRSDHYQADRLQIDRNFEAELWVKWGCTDLDDGYDTSLPDALAIVYALKKLGVQAHIERSKGKGYHVWVFADQWVPAEIMRRALLAAHQAADVRPTEVNPKQTTLAKLGRGVGNYVNLPYWTQAEPNTRTMLAGTNTSVHPISYPQWVADVQPSTFDTLLDAARLYVEPPKRTIGTIEEPDGELKTTTDKLSGLAYTIYSKGPLEGMDRSDTLARLGHKCRESGLEPGETLTVLRDADKRWGKFSDRPDCEEQLQKLVENAYTK